MLKGNYYRHIEDCTVYAWEKALGGDLTYLRLDDNGNEKQDLEAWEECYNSYIVELGLGKDYERLIKLQSDKAKLQLTFVITGKRLILNRINVIESEIKDLINNKKHGEDITTTLIMLTKWIGSKVDQKNTTVLELYKMLEVVKKESDQNKQK